MQTHAAGVYLPLLVVLLLVSFYTLGYAIYLSVHDIDLMSPPPFDFIGMANFIEVLQEPRMWSSLWNTLVYVAGSTVAELVLGSAIALFISRDFLAVSWYVRCYCCQ